MRDPYLDKLKNDFNKYTSDLKKIKKETYKDRVFTRARENHQTNRQYCKNDGK
ncbi:hypothetical protein AAA799E16_00566 [Marine Group I thaumarchaeote SCGC AAA799-E16]|uniref:Uncharacterized protein n=1 Tax=Marine Group I thaumarchaeote SCGC AAA799-E16 TaxID=1502292 RepID=A0A081S6V1_9ARCH|nr:hypothetical protein AAA799E16_00566 [Marine Group I thaumarchaeote SCGC AAA799-E16]